MNYLKYLSILLSVLIFSSCSVTKKLEKSITGKWSIVKLEDESQNSDENYQKMIKDLLKDSYIEFKTDKTFEVSVMNQKQKGDWKISEDGKKILTSKDNVFFEILNQTETSLKLKSTKDSKSVILELKKT